eukprot:EC784413.1.p4 GENE.EC784413.1~~EC784413.1.p4  ORF type:complete len:63 (-),score=13.74 EC784413.1:70-258(-)
MSRTWMSLAFFRNAISSSFPQLLHDAHSRVKYQSPSRPPSLLRTCAVAEEMAVAAFALTVVG